MMKDKPNIVINVMITVDAIHALLKSINVIIKTSFSIEFLIMLIANQNKSVKPEYLKLSAITTIIIKI